MWMLPLIAHRWLLQKVVDQTISRIAGERLLDAVERQIYRP
jgi:hypothetical protein